jgi:hypothetical protein
MHKFQRVRVDEFWTVIRSIDLIECFSTKI